MSALKSQLASLRQYADQIDFGNDWRALNNYKNELQEWRRGNNNSTDIFAKLNALTDTIERVKLKAELEALTNLLLENITIKFDENEIQRKLHLAEKNLLKESARSKMGNLLLDYVEAIERAIRKSKRKMVMIDCSFELSMRFDTQCYIELSKEMLEIIKDYSSRVEQAAAAHQSLISMCNVHYEKYQNMQATAQDFFYVESALICTSFLVMTVLLGFAAAINPVLIFGCIILGLLALHFALVQTPELKIKLQARHLLKDLNGFEPDDPPRRSLFGFFCHKLHISDEIDQTIDQALQKLLC